MSPDIHTLSGAYALDAMSVEQRSDFEKHLAHCPSCEAEVRELRATAARLGESAATQPPAALRARVIAEVARTRQQAPLPAAAPAPAPAPAGPVRLLSVAAAVLAVLAGVLGVTAYRADQRADLVAAQGQAVAEVLAADDAETVRGSVEGGGRGTVVVSRQADEMAFVGTDLAATGDDQTYQLWLIPADGPARSAGLLGPEGGDVARAVEGELSDVAVFGLSVEPSGGSPQPTEPVLLLELPA